MATIDQGQPVEVHIGSCLCPGGSRPTPVHPDGDLVYLRPKPSLEMALAAQSSLWQSGEYMGDSNAAIYSAFVRYGVIAWNIVNETGPVPVTPAAVLDRLDWLSGGQVVSNQAIVLYQDKVFPPPLAPAKAEPSRPSHKTSSTSPNRRSKRNTRTSSEPSSPSDAEAGS